jgi:hypothetical protein
MSTNKLCIYIDYMVAFVNIAWIYNIEKLNNGEYSTDRKHLSVKYSFKYAKWPLGSLQCGYYVCVCILGPVGSTESIMKMKVIIVLCIYILFHRFFFAYLLLFIALVS